MTMASHFDLAASHFQQLGRQITWKELMLCQWLATMVHRTETDDVVKTRMVSEAIYSIMRKNFLEAPDNRMVALAFLLDLLGPNWTMLEYQRQNPGIVSQREANKIVIGP